MSRFRGSEILSLVFFAQNLYASSLALRSKRLSLYVASQNLKPPYERQCQCTLFGRDTPTTYLLPQFLEECLAFLLRVVKGIPLSEIVPKPSKRRHPISVQLCTSFLILILFFLRKLALPHRQAKIRCSLEHRHRRSILRRLLRDLNTSRSSSNNSNLLALCGNSAFRPERGMVHFTLERVQTLPVGEVALCGKPDGIDEVLRVCGAAILGLDVPLVCLQIELSADDARVESSVFLDLKLSFDVGEVAA